MHRKYYKLFDYKLINLKMRINNKNIYDIINTFRNIIHILSTKIKIILSFPSGKNIKYYTVIIIST